MKCVKKCNFLNTRVHELCEFLVRKLKDLLPKRCFEIELKLIFQSKIGARISFSYKHEKDIYQY